MRLTQVLGVKVALCLLLVFVVSMPAPAQDPAIGINIALKGKVTPAILADLRKLGTIRDVIYEINAVIMVGRSSVLPIIQAKPYVAAANPDAERAGKPLDTVAATNFADGNSTWDLDAEDVTDFGVGRTSAYDGTGVYVAVLDTGLVDSWRQYFPQERIATQYAKSFQGGGALSVGAVSESTNKWEHDQSSHGTHVTSTILGFKFPPRTFNGMAPKSTVIPVKVLNQNGSGWSSVIARGIVYVTGLKMGPLAGSPMVINMSLSGSALDAVEKAAVDFAVSHGVILVAAAGNRANNGMGFPGAYTPVISVAAAGWVHQWTDIDGDGIVGNWWRRGNVGDPTVSSDFFIADFSSRAKMGQDLDVTAPGDWVVGPFQTNSGQLSFFFLSGTSMSSPHVAGIVALMAQKNPGINSVSGDPLNAEAILEAAASGNSMNSGCKNVTLPTGSMQDICWGPGNDPATSLDADGAGFVTAEAALALTP